MAGGQTDRWLLPGLTDHWPLPGIPPTVTSGLLNRRYVTWTDRWQWQGERPILERPNCQGKDPTARGLRQTDIGQQVGLRQIGLMADERPED